MVTATLQHIYIFYCIKKYTVIIMPGKWNRPSMNTRMCKFYVENPKMCIFMFVVVYICYGKYDFLVNMHKSNLFT